MDGIANHFLSAKKCTRLYTFAHTISNNFRIPGETPECLDPILPLLSF